MDKVSNKDLWERTSQVQIEIEILKRGWLGHTSRKPNSNITRQALTWNTQGKRKMGEAEKYQGTRLFEADITQTGLSW